MSCSCCDNQPPAPGDTRAILWLALAINAAMCAVEIGASIAAGSTALQADALDFLADAMNYAISLSVAGLALTWRTRAAMVKGYTMGAFGLGVFGSAAWHTIHGAAPAAELMGIVGVFALVANGSIALMLYRYRASEANLRSVWLCARNDALGNVAVLLAALGVFGTGTAWPDIAVAAIMASLYLSGAWQVIRQSVAELGRQSGQSVHQH
jgi:Co/Zn/Cd efflux system component